MSEGYQQKKKNRINEKKEKRKRKASTSIINRIKIDEWIRDFRARKVFRKCEYRWRFNVQRNILHLLRALFQ